jgi:hypothetical protein
MEMAKEKKGEITRREAIKSIGAGAGVVATLPVLGVAQDHSAHGHARQTSKPPAARMPLKFFTEEEHKTVIEMSELIIPADESSPGAKAAGVSQYIDLIVSESNDLTKQTWRDGLAAINKMSRDRTGVAFAAATLAQQTELLKEISKNEKSPQTLEERFFRTIKNMTVDGYYTSEIGIHKELRYKGNSYLTEFTGCTHPEHQS